MAGNWETWGGEKIEGQQWGNGGSHWPTSQPQQWGGGGRVGQPSQKKMQKAAEWKQMKDDMKWRKHQMRPMMQAPQQMMPQQAMMPPMMPQQPQQPMMQPQACGMMGPTPQQQNYGLGGPGPAGSGLNPNVELAPGQVMIQRPDGTVTVREAKALDGGKEGRGKSKEEKKKEKRKAKKEEKKARKKAKQAEKRAASSSETDTGGDTDPGSEEGEPTPKPTRREKALQKEVAHAREEAAKAKEGHMLGMIAGCSKQTSEVKDILMGSMQGGSMAGTPVNVMGSNTVLSVPAGDPQPRVQGAQQWLCAQPPVAVGPTMGPSTSTGTLPPLPTMGMELVMCRGCPFRGGNNRAEPGSDMCTSCQAFLHGSSTALGTSAMTTTTTTTTTAAAGSGTTGTPTTAGTTAGPMGSSTAAPAAGGGGGAGQIPAAPGGGPIVKLNLDEYKLYLVNLVPQGETQEDLQDTIREAEGKDNLHEAFRKGILREVLMRIVISEGMALSDYEKSRMTKGQLVNKLGDLRLE